jgi:hypothetical protein
MDFRNRGLSPEDFEVADHFSNRRLTFSDPERRLGETLHRELFRRLRAAGEGRALSAPRNKSDWDSARA